MPKMFRSPYSPFFTSGLLSDRHCSSEPHRRGSLPTDSLNSPSSPATDVSTLYLVSQPKRDAEQYRSFLSLDLAEAQSLRNAALKRHEFGATSPGVSSPQPLWATPAAPLRQRPSRDFSVPSPKPAPSATLPAVPRHKQQRSISPKQSPHVPLRPSVSASRTSTSTTSSEDILPEMLSRSGPAVLPKLRQLQRSDTIATRSTALSSSTVSTGYRRNQRSNALACLEGRSKQPLRAPRLRQNFMNLSDDDEDEGSEGYDAADDDSDSSNDDFVQIEEAAPHHQSIPISALVDDEDWIMRSPTQSLARAHSFSRSTPSLPMSPTKPSSHRTPGRKHHRTSTMSDWLPLQSFMDLKNEREDDPVHQWSWRSFIEVVAVQ